VLTIRRNAQRQSTSVEGEHRVRVGVLDGHGRRGEPRRLGQVRAGPAETERRARRIPRQRYPASVAADLDSRVAEEHRILPPVVGDLANLVQAELLPLVEIGGTGQCEHQQRGRFRPAQTKVGVDLGGIATREQPISAAAIGLGCEVGWKSVAGGMPHDVVVGEHPGRGGARIGSEGEAVGDDLAEALGVEVGLQEAEVERLAQAVRAGVPRQTVGRNPRFGHRHAWRVVLVEHRAPLGVDLVHLVPVVERMGTVDTAQQQRRLHLRRAGERFGQVLGQAVGDVDPEAVDPPVGPEPQRRQKVLPHLGVVPVEVRLLLGEQVEVPLTVGNLRPCRSAEPGGPVRRRQGAVRSAAVAEDVPVARRRALRRGQRFLEPAVPVGAVVGHDVDDQPDARGVQPGRHLVEVGQGTDPGVDVAVIVDVVSSVGQRRRVERREPHGVHAERLEVRDPADDPGQISDPVIIRVGEAPRVDLIHHRLTPPEGSERGESVEVST
jgi:hypothetical protein